MEIHPASVCARKQITGALSIRMSYVRRAAVVSCSVLLEVTTFGEGLEDGLTGQCGAEFAAVTIGDPDCKGTR
jgi:hypothetical protein